MGAPTIKICILSYKKLTEIVNSVICRPPYTSMDFLVLDCSLENVAVGIETALKQGCEAFIAGSANAAEFRRISQEQLTEIQIHPVDYILAVKKALSMGRSPAIYTYRFTKVPDLSILDEVFGQKIRHVVYEDTYDLTESLAHTDADVIIGSSMVVDIAERMDIRAVLLYAGVSAVEDAINLCQRTVSNNRKVQGLQELYRGMLLCEKRGVIGINENDRVILYNEPAARITGIHRRSLQGQSARELFPWAHLEETEELLLPVSHAHRQIGGTAVDVECRRIRLSGSSNGVLIYLTPGGGRQERESGTIISPDQRRSFGELDNASRAMRECISQATYYCGLNAPILVYGEAGTGKTLIAMSIHEHYSREKPLELINCMNIDPRFLMQFFFGRENGAGELVYTGLLERCANGTIVLSNVDCTPPVFQRALSQAIRTHSFQRINGCGWKLLSTRWITIAEDTDPENLRTRMDARLYHTLSVLPLKVPPLRERTEDIPAIFRGFVNKSFPQGSFRPLRSVRTLSGILSVYSWPGNIDELRGIAQRFAATISAPDYPVGANYSKAMIAAIGEEKLWEDILAHFGGREKLLEDPRRMQEFLERVKKGLAYNNSVVAEKLGISRTTLWRMTRSEGEDGMDKDGSDS